MIRDKKCPGGYVNRGRYLQLVVQTFQRRLSSFEEFDVPGRLGGQLFFHAFSLVESLLWQMRAKALHNVGAKTGTTIRIGIQRILKGFSALCCLAAQRPLSKVIAPKDIFDGEAVQFRVLSLHGNGFAPIEQNQSLEQARGPLSYPDRLDAEVYVRICGKSTAFGKSYTPFSVCCRTLSETMHCMS